MDISSGFTPPLKAKATPLNDVNDNELRVGGESGTMNLKPAPLKPMENKFNGSVT